MGIGYGITASDAIVRGLENAGLKVIRPLIDMNAPGGQSDRASRMRWVLSAYAVIADVLNACGVDFVFCFHSFSTFPAEIRRIATELGANVSLIGYTHGSHWDPSDGVRLESYPGLEMVDLANLCSLDYIFFDSSYFLRLVLGNIADFNDGLARRLARRALAVGLPLNVDLIDRFQTNESFGRTTVVFNHAPVAAKRPELFMKAAQIILSRYDCNVLITRHFAEDAPGAWALARLREVYGDRVILGENLNHEAYYRALWMASIQVSTAAHESLGVSTLEAMYTRNCCFAPMVGSYPDILAAERYCLYRDVDELVAKLSQVLDNLEMATEIGMHLAEEARRFEPNAIVAQIIAVMQSLRSSGVVRAR
jgi:glycosyltransferase involved in cell wall biosynthesis